MSSPFLVSPYSGWTEVVSFLDHDSPDYTVDGRIVIANGLSATAAQGQASDLFPSYWSPGLRQYVNYDGHNGYDFDLSYQPLLAAASGTVAFAGWNGASEYAGYGQMILLRHRDGYVTLYGHLSRLDVKAGDKVSAGQQIGISGSTGHSSGPHLHFTVFHDCRVVDPYGWTGQGQDPLTSFDGEHSDYLWLPGHEPQLLNPPPSWPSYPLGLHISVPPEGTPPSTAHATQVEPVDRLLLLDLPSPRSNVPVAAGVALARTEASVTEEAGTLTPQLDELMAQGLVRNYQVIPAAAAVWVRGTASAAQLEALTGVASLTGVRPRDLSAAQSGLGHSVLIQIGRQQAPSLWPVGYRSSLHAWRPITSIVNDHALVAGFALPGQKVVVSLHRRNTAPGVTEALGDPETGGFVAMLHDPTGTPVPVRAGDVVEIQTSDRVLQIRVKKLSLKARTRTVTGNTANRETISILATNPESSAGWTGLGRSGSHGRFLMRTPREMRAGTLIVGSMVDGGGNQESATAYVPGILATEGASTISGWTVGHGPRLEVWRHARRIAVRSLHPAPDGTFQIDLQQQHRPVTLRPADEIVVGSKWHHRRLVLPSLSTSLTPARSTIGVRGPRGARIRVAFSGATGHTWSRTVALAPSGVSVVRLPPRTSIGAGDSVSAEFVMQSGDRVRAMAAARRIVLDMGTGRISGHIHTGSVVTFWLEGPSGKPMAQIAATGNSSTGAFSGVLHDSLGRTVRVPSHVRLIIRDKVSSTAVSIPTLSVAYGAKEGFIDARATETSSATLEVARAHSGNSRRQFTPADAGHVRLAVSRAEAKDLTAVKLIAPVADGISIVRTAPVITGQHPVAQRARSCRSQHRPAQSGHAAVTAHCSTSKAGKR